MIKRIFSDSDATRGKCIGHSAIAFDTARRVPFSNEYHDPTKIGWPRLIAFELTANLTKGGTAPAKTIATAPWNGRNITVIDKMDAFTGNAGTRGLALVQTVFSYTRMPGVSTATLTRSTEFVVVNLQCPAGEDVTVVGSSPAPSA